MMGIRFLLYNEIINTANGEQCVQLLLLFYYNT